MLYKSIIIETIMKALNIMGVKYIYYFNVYGIIVLYYLD